jgi:excinuclease ABC subunit B
VTPRATVLRAIEAIKEELRERIAWFTANNKLVEAQRIEQRTRSISKCSTRSASARVSKTTHGICRAPAGRVAADADRLPAADALMFIDESHVSIGQVGACTRGSLAQGESGRLWLPTAVGAGQPAAPVRRIRSALRQTVCFGNAG